MKILLLSSRRSAYGAQVLEAARRASLEIAGAVIEEQPSRGGWRRIWRYIRRHGLPAVLARGIELGLARIAGDFKTGETVEEAATRLQIPFQRLENLNMPAAQAVIARYGPDAGLLAGTRILKGDCVALFPKGLINAHLGHLPKYRGNYGNRWALLNGERCGVSVYLLDAGLDTGPILKVQCLDLQPGESLVASEERFTSPTFALLKG